MTLLRTAILVLTLLALAFCGNAFAEGDDGGSGVTPGPSHSGRWSVRIEVPWAASGYVETIIWQAGDLEVTAGVMARARSLQTLVEDPLEVTPYSGVAWYSESFWLAAEVAAPVTLGQQQRLAFGLAVSAGGRF